MLAYERLGEQGIPVLFLHGGWGYSIYPIDHQACALAPHCRFFIPSRSGYGRSSRISHFELNFHEMAAMEMLAFLDATHIQRCVVWGHSDGAVIAARMGLLAPERCYGLVLEAFHFWPEKPASADFFAKGATGPDYLSESEVQKHRTSKKELDNIRALIARDLADAAVAGLSADRRFAIAYNAALPVSNMAIACAGFRVTSSTGHHRISLESVR
jgi:pimeloyl-ACP methyl ester carboxylesterase